MKKATFAMLFSVLLICACIFASCNTNSSLFSGDSENTDSDTDALYSAMIRDLENQIIELQQSQYISQAENQKELTRLQNLLAELKGNTEESKKEDPPISPDSSDNGSDPSSPSQTESTPTFLYIRENDTLTITGYTGTEESLVLPSYIDGYAVHAIADNAFQSDTLQSVVIPHGVTTVGWFAFYECPALISVTIPASVTSIGYSAFPSAVNAAFTVYCHNDSFAQKYAASYGLSYATI